MKKELKKQIKQDELRTGFDHAAVWASTHRDEVRIALIAVIVLGLAAVGYGSYRSHREASAERAFDEALTVFHAPVAGDPASAAGGTVYTTAAEKNQKAAAAFADVAKRYASSATGRRARYYAALANRDLGKTAEAEAELKELSSGSDDDALIRGLARLALADLHRSRRQWDAAIDGYRKIVDDGNSAVPRDHALMQLAATLEEAQRTPEAAKAYLRLIDEFPSSAYAADARRRSEYLGAKG